ncbi:MAG TPA: hypothetical protein VFM38_09350, partial [Candidatus Limnocylindrales bacterium]|nr:hypothetical protein [Candidatus Limnocylindrales bacterium]
MSATAATLDAPGTPARLMRNLQRVAALLAVASVGLAGVVVAYGVYGSVAFLTPNLVTGGFLGIIVIFPAMGALIIQRRPATRVAWLMVLLGISMGVGLAMYAYGLNGLPPSEPQPFAMAAMLGSQMFFIPALGTATTLILLLFPDDRFLSVRWRLVAWLAAISAAVYVLTGLVQPGLVDAEYLPGIWNPLGVPSDLGPAVRLLNNAANLSELLALLLASISLIVRYRRADRIVAAQIRWLAAVAVLLVLVFSLSLIPADEAIGDLVFGLALCLLASVPIAIGIAIKRYRLYEIDRLINRALVYGSLTAILAGVFTAGVGLAQRMFVAVTHETSDAAVVGATLVVATLYAPLRKRLEAIVDRRFKFEDARFGGYRDELTRYLALTEPGRAWPRLTSESVRELD